MSTQPQTTSAVVDPELAAGVAPSPSAQPAQPARLTEGEVLEKLAGAPTAEEPPVSTGKPPEVAPPGEPEAAPEVVEPIEEPEIETAPEGYDDFSKFRDAIKAHPELRDIIGRHRALTDLFPQFSEARQIREWFPDLAAAEAAVEDSDSLRTLYETYTSDPGAFVEHLRETDGNAFSTLVRQFPTILHRLDSRAYSDQVFAMTSSSLRYLYQLAGSRQDGELSKAVEAVSAALGLPLGGTMAAGADARDQEITRLRAELDRSRAGDGEQAYWGFHEAVDSAYTENALTLIAAEVKARVPKASEPLHQRLVRDSWARLQDLLDSQTQVKSRVERAYAAAGQGRISVTDQRALLEFVTGRAKASVPAAVRAVLEEWKQMGVFKPAAATATAAVPAAAPAPSPGGAPSRPQLKPQSSAGSPAPGSLAKRRTEDDIFRDLTAQVRGV